MYLQYERDASVRGIPVYKFSVPDKFYKAPANEPDNACFCTSDEGMRSSLCTTDGVLDISTCKKGAPIVLSSPHFFNGDARLFQGVRGLKPEKRFHETFLEIEPVSMFICRVKEFGDSSFSCHHSFHRSRDWFSMQQEGYKSMLTSVTEKNLSEYQVAAEKLTDDVTENKISNKNTLSPFVYHV